jgi:hypothetical protein
MLCNSENSIVKSKSAFARAVQKISNDNNGDDDPAGVANKIRHFLHF